MKNNDIRRCFLEYYQKNGHTILPSAAVVPDNDPTLMFTSAGMVPFKDIFTGAALPPTPPRVVTSQKCLRAGGKHNDLENVGYTTRHHTFFEMLGNFSFGDYFKERAIELAWHLITGEFGLPKEKLLVTVYHDDDEAAGYWQTIAGLPESRILRINSADNFWQMGDVGPCGPCSEIFYDHGDHLPGGPPGTPEEDGPRFIEIWNLVFMQYEHQADGTRIHLPSPSIDTGMGLERIGAVLQGVHDNYDTDSLRRLAEAVGHELHTDPFGSQAASHKVIVDHLRACSFMIADGVMPSNEGRGYVLRRILRRALRHAHLLGAREPMIHRLLPSLISEMGDYFHELVCAEATINETLRLESVRFLDMLDRGLKLLDTEAAHLARGDQLDGSVAFKLYDTFGFPVDLTADILRNRGASVDMVAFDAAMEAQRQRARAAWAGTGDTGQDRQWQAIDSAIHSTEFLGYQFHECEAEILELIVDDTALERISAPCTALLVTNQTPFYAEAGGQQGDHGWVQTPHARAEVTDTQKQRGIIGHNITLHKGELARGDSVKLSIDQHRRQQLQNNHSTTHLLHGALRSVLGEHVAQKGSLVTPESLRFDFSHGQPLSGQEKHAIEEIINHEIRYNSAITTRVMTPEAAIEHGAMALFGEKYGDEVRVVCMGSVTEDVPFSLELCGGTHAKHTGDIGAALIQGERGVASGIRRIEVVTGTAALAANRQLQKRLQAIADNLKVPVNDVESRVQTLIAERQDMKKQLGQRYQQQASSLAQQEVNGIMLYHEYRSHTPAKALKSLADQWKQGYNQGVYMVIGSEQDKASVVIASKNPEIDAVPLVRAASAALGGKGGGGRQDLAQAGGTKTDSASIDAAIQQVIAAIQAINL